MVKEADINETAFLLQYTKKDGSNEVIKNMLKDHTTQQNIYWATDSYNYLGEGYAFFDAITIDKITQEHEGVIRPRVFKSKEEQSQRSKDMAEVFTPSWICNAQNNLIDEAWFGRKEVFNREICDKEGKHYWETNPDKIDFPNTPGRTWKDYVADLRMEITCGEGPYLASRYDSVTGEKIENVKERIGLLDRKLRIVSENTRTSDDWLKWGKIALRSIYGFEWQGDNLLLAREALFFSFLEHYQTKFDGKNPDNRSLPGVAYIISWNIWQMDGLTYGLPGYQPKEKDKYVQGELFAENRQAPIKPQEQYCLIKDFIGRINIHNEKLTNQSFHDQSATKLTFKSLVEKK